MIAPAILVIALVFASPLPVDSPPEVEAPRNLVLMIADGFGPTSLTLGRAVGERTMVLDTITVGSVGVASAVSLIPDSAASATALASGVTTHNGIVGLDAQFRSVPTLVELARDAGLHTGIVTTTSLTHATPAAFAAHVPNRGMQPTIAEQMLETGVDLMLGGGSQDFVPPGDGQPGREDGRDLLADFRKRGGLVVRSSAGLEAADMLPLVGLFAPGHMDYELDREPAEQPSIAEMTRRALELLSGEGGRFVLVIEGGRIDHAGHENDPATHAREVLAYDEAVGAALAFAREDGETLVVSTADHETGGLTLARPDKGNWDPDALRRVESSVGHMVDQVRDGASSRAVLEEQAGVTALTAEEQEAVDLANTMAPDFPGLDDAFAAAISREAGVSWSTGGHSGADVTLFAFGPGAADLRGYHEIAALGRLLRDLMGFTVDEPAPATDDG